MGFFDIIMFPFAWFFAQLYAFTGNYGWAIILFTIVTKIIMLPLAAKQQKTMLNQVKYQPRIKEIQEKYKTNKVKMNEEMQKLYTEEGYNPLSGCLPILIQLPLIIILYNVIQNPLTNLLGYSAQHVETIKTMITSLINSGKIDAPLSVVNSQIGLYSTVNENITKIPELSAGIIGWKSLNFTFFGLDLVLTPTLAFNALIIIPILAVITALILSIVTQKYSATPQNSNSKMMMLLSPAMSLFFVFTFSAGIGLYWVIGNVLSIVQAYVLGEMYNPQKYAEKLQDEQNAEKEKLREIKRAKNSAKYKYQNKKNPDVIDAEFVEIDDENNNNTLKTEE